MDANIGQAEVAGMLSVYEVFASPDPSEPIIDTARCGARSVPDRPSDAWTSPPLSVVPVPIRQPWVSDFIEPWPMQKIASDMVEFAETLHRDRPVARAIPADDIEDRHLKLIDLEEKLIALLARNGIRRDDPTGSVFDPRSHQKVAEQATSEEVPGTVVRALSASWTLNGQLLRPAMVVVSTTSPDDRSADATVVVFPIKFGG